VESPQNKFWWIFNKGLKLEKVLPFILLQLLCNNLGVETNWVG
jgi:hypothetical protein